jgi:hypothetical protein
MRTMWFKAPAGGYLITKIPGCFLSISICSELISTFLPEGNLTGAASAGPVRNRTSKKLTNFKSTA